LQAVLFLQVMHSWYQDLLTQFTSNQKDLSLATIVLVVANARFIDDVEVVGAKNKPSVPSRLLALPSWLPS